MQTQTFQEFDMADNKQGASQASQMKELPTLRRLSDDRTHALEDTHVIGRHADCDLLIDDEKGVSRKHARITLEEGVVHIEDLGSLNGTLVNGEEIDGKHPLAHGDVLIFDEQEYELVVPYDASSAGGYDPAMTVIANRSAIKKRIEKKRLKKEREAATEGAVSEEASAQDSAIVPASPLPEGSAANHTRIDQPRRQPGPSMRLVDEHFLREVQANDVETASNDAESIDGNLGDAEASDSRPTAQMSAIEEAFDVSDDEVDDILHAETPGGEPTRFVAEGQHDSSDSARIGSAPFLTRQEQQERSSARAAAFIRGTEHSASITDRHRGPASDTVHAQLIVLDGGRHYRLPIGGDRTSWTVGSANSADIRIADQGVASDHAIILKEESIWTLCDRGTSSGCSVNGHPVSVARIQLGDKIRIGSAECLFTAAEDESGLAPAPASVSTPVAAPAAAPASSTSGRRPMDDAPSSPIDDDDPMDQPRMRIEFPMDDRIWDEHEQQLYRDTSKDRILQQRKQSSRHEPEFDRAPRRQPSMYASWEPPAASRRPGVRRFLPSVRTLTIVALGAVAFGVLGALAYLLL